MKAGIHCFRLILTGTILYGSLCALNGQPSPGDVFREFTYVPEYGHFGELDPGCTRDFEEDFWKNKPRMVVKTLDLQLEHAIRAEMSVEYWGGHIGTSEQKFSINGQEWIYIAQPENTPTDPHCYQRTMLGNTAVPVPMDFLKEGANEFRFTCGPQICYNFNFGFYWIYSFTVRIFYDPSVPHPEGKISSIRHGETIEDHPTIELELSEGSTPVKKADYIGYYRDFDWEGNGRFTQWHYQTRFGQMYKHIGTSSAPPFNVLWNTKWLPDQKEPVSLAAVLTDENGISYMTPAISDLTFHREDRKVHMYISGDVPESFAVRIGRVKSCTIGVEDDITHATSACLLVSTWSGKCDDGSVHEILLNGTRISDNFGVMHNYSFDYLSIPVELIREGANEISIHSTFEGHALEINWPGPVLFIEFDN